MGSSDELTGHPEIRLISFSYLIIPQQDSKILLLPPSSMFKRIISCVALTTFCHQIHGPIKPKLQLEMNLIVSMFLHGRRAKTAN